MTHRSRWVGYSCNTPWFKFSPLSKLLQNRIASYNLSSLNETLIASFEKKEFLMHKILGRDYITRKEAATRYGLSVAWFKARHNRHEEPRFIKIKGTGRA